MPVTIVEVAAPEYTVTRAPDFLAVGSKVDRAIEASFPDGRYVLRAIGLDDHPGLTLSALVRVVLENGTDKHDPDREAVGQEEFSGYDYDLQAGPIEVRHSRLVVGADERFPTVFGGIVWHFYHDAPLDRGHAVRIDLLILYDPRLVTRAHKFHPEAKSVRRGLDRFLYRFEDRANKKEALRGLVKVLR